MGIQLQHPKTEAPACSTNSRIPSESPLTARQETQSGGASGATTYASTWDPDSAFGFSAKIEDYSYRLLGERSMLASVEAANSPAQACANDDGRTVCPENWEMRHLYVIEATAKPRSIWR